jgi:2-amino-4-hydroxy-6-hydroxymethyldihydropteridine diphosphokinase
MSSCFICLGTNQGNRNSNLEQAIKLIARHIGQIKNLSSIYETEPWGFESQEWFLNQVAQVETDINPEMLLNHFLDIEKALGRQRSEGQQFASRIIDLDILFIDNQIIQRSELIVPHPRFHQRRFVLTPLAQIAPEFIHPILNKTILQLLDECEDVSEVRKVEKE